MLDLHWTSDVVAGLALGWAWFAACAIAFGGWLLEFGAPVERSASPERAGAGQSARGPSESTCEWSGRSAPAGSPCAARKIVTRRLERQIEALEREGPVDRRRLAQLVGARYLGPCRFRVMVGEALREGWARKLSGGAIAPPQR